MTGEWADNLHWDPNLWVVGGSSSRNPPGARDGAGPSPFHLGYMYITCIKIGQDRIGLGLGGFLVQQN